MSGRRPATAIVVGAGVAGLAAAWELRRALPEAEIVVLEASGRVGGKIRTTTFAGRPVDEGADAFLARVPDAVTLAREVGLGDQLVSPATGEASLWVRGELRPIPAGHVLGVPTDVDLVASSGILSPDGVERARREPLLGGSPVGPDDDVAIGELVAQRFGDEVQDLLVDPLIGGINAARSRELSAEVGAAQLLAAARRDASLTKGLLALRAEQPPADPGAPVFWAPAGGMQRLVDALADALADAGVEIRTGEGPGSLAELDAAAAVVLATPAGVSSRLLRPLSPDAAALLAGIDYASVVLTTLAYRRRDLTRPLSGSGFLVPRVEGRFLTAASVLSNKWPALDDPELVILRASAGRAGDDTAIALDDEQLVERVHAELCEALSIAGDPVEVRISRWRRAFPQFRPGHRRRMADIQRRLAEDAPGVALAGAHVGGVGIPACIRSGREAARRCVGGS